MNTRNDAHERRNPGSGARGGTARISAGRYELKRMIASGAMLAFLLMVLIAIGLLATGCGGEKSASTQTQSSAGAVTTQPSEQVVLASNPPAPAISPIATSPSVPQGASPDIEVASLDTLVAPGQMIELAVQATGDTRELTLYDGINDPQALYLDTAANLWKVSYRVPLRPKQERLGLSVTARNETGRWRRVWIFLHVQSPETKVTAESEPGSDH